uniref:STAM binding protein b n=1 Tax=Cyprinus carpio TaxID=7962 RepID=A0A8C1MP02_CYPCA
MLDYADVSLTPDERVYFRSGMEVIRMAHVYAEEGNTEHAFVLYNIYITLFIEKLPKHPEYNLSNIPEKKESLKKLKETAFPQAEQLRTYEKEYAEFISKNRAEDQVLERELSQQLELERRRVADMQRRQLEQVQFSMFEEMIRQKDHQRERQLSPTSPQSPQYPSANHSAPSAPPTFDRSLKPGHLTTLVDGLRQIAVPAELCGKFLRLANNNTVRAVETYGILCERLNTVVLLQSSFRYRCRSAPQTHPTQTAFLSSADLHTHSYSFRNFDVNIFTIRVHLFRTGYLRLTDYGMEEISTCTQKGFHPHPKEPPFTGGNHIRITESTVSMLDLR